MDITSTKEELTCPLCEKDNACGVVLRGSSMANCWCKKIVIDGIVLEQISKADMSKRCICEICSQKNLSK